MDRRGFLKFLGLGAVTAAVLPTLPFKWAAAEEVIIAPGVLAPAAAIRLHMGLVAQIALKELNAALARPSLSGASPVLVPSSPVYLLAEAKLGSQAVLREAYTGLETVTLDQQWGVEIAPWDDPRDVLDLEEFTARYIRPPVWSLADNIREHRPRVFGELPLPHGVQDAAVVSSRTLGTSIRALSAYNVMKDRQHLRLDVLCG